MANRWFNQFRLQLEKQVVSLFGDVTFAGGGAPTLVVANSKGIASIVRTGAGAYTVTLQDAYVRLLMVASCFINATAPAAPGLYVVSTTVGSSGSAQPVIFLQFQNDAGAATDPGSGEEVLLQFNLSNSTAS